MLSRKFSISELAAFYMITVSNNIKQGTIDKTLMVILTHPEI